uniref:Uncharacterized protein n=1 Tax=Utricularia reniformis TaxID=192314 RepID=A0A1Y0B1A1_9LAMI|nr:hypothetical protein AEK19_MT1002 [Utricularia reniformis]ART31226.1 hypothetical protein AEK19_MT1002 [Utricularia reniformis]
MEYEPPVLTLPMRSQVFEGNVVPVPFLSKCISAIHQSKIGKYQSSQINSVLLLDNG